MSKNKYMNFWKQSQKTGLVLLFVFSFLLSGVDSAIGQNGSHINDENVVAQVLSDNKAADENLMSIQFTNITLKGALEILADEINIGFSYNPDIMPDKKVSFEMSNVPAHEVVYKLLEGTDLEPVLPPSKDVIIIREKIVEIEPEVIQETVRGTVVDAKTGESLPGVNILVVGTNIGTSTDMNGEYELEVPNLQETLVFAYVGYERLEVAIDSRNEINIELTEQAVGLDDVVVTGTAGETRAREIGNTVSRINVDDIQETVGNTEHMLQARTPGLVVTETSGGTGAGSQIRLRGNTSLTQGNQPLFVIDGVRVGVDNYPRGRALGDSFFRGPNITPSPLNDLNPSDIERIEVIKGPAAATLYGTEAASGVIQIFTRQGETGATRWTAQVDQGANFMLPFGTDEHPYMRSDRFLRTGHNQAYNLSARGGTESVNYFVSGRLSAGQGVLLNDDESRRVLRTNLNFTSMDHFRIDVRAMLSRHEINNTSTGNNAQGIQFNINRSYLAPNNPIGSQDMEEMAKLLDQTLETVNERYQTSVTVRHDPSERFNSRLTFGYDRLNNSYKNVRPFGFVLQSQGAIANRVWTGSSTTLDYMSRFQLPVSEDINLSLSWGAEGNINTEERIDAFGQGFPGPGNHTVTNAAERITHTSEFRVITGGGFVQSRIGLRDNLFMTVGLRLDGNSAFGEDFGFQPYPKASVSYVISDENFWPDILGERMRLRAAYGQAGRAPGAFDAVRTWQATGYIGVPAFQPQNVGNPVLGPEVTNELELGFEASYLGQRLNIDFTYYDQVTRDALFDVSQPGSRGFTGSQLENVGELKNQGIELDLNADLYQSADFQVSLGTNISTNISEVLDTGGQVFYSIVEGQPAPVVRGDRVMNPDENAPPIIEEDYFYGASQPTHTIGLNLTVGFPSGISLNANGEYQGGFYINNVSEEFSVSRGAGTPTCDAAYAEVPWGTSGILNHPNVGNISALEIARCYQETHVPDSWIMPGDFFKLRNLSLLVPLSNVVPQIVPAGIESATLTFSARNIWRWTNKDFGTYDPEGTYRGLNETTRTAGNDNIPAPASVTGTLRINW